MGRYWLTTLPLSIGESFELFSDGQRIAHVMHHGGSRVTSLAVVNDRYDLNVLASPEFLCAPGISSGGRRRLQTALTRCIEVAAAPGRITLAGCAVRRDVISTELIFGILHTIGKGLIRRCEIELAHLSQGETSLALPPPALTSDDVNPISDRNQYWQSVHDVQWATATEDLLSSWGSQHDVLVRQRLASTRLSVPYRLANRIVRLLK